MSEWIAKNAYLSQSEMENNALIIYSYFAGKGWTKNAISALLGNMEVESTINPGIWESLEPYGGGWGLVQWTPYTKYSEWAGDDWESNWNKQLNRIIWELENNEQYYSTNAYPETFREFSVSTKSAYYLAGAFLYNYERPDEPDANDRGNRAERWFEFLGGEPVQPPSKKVPIWLLFEIQKRSYAK